MLYYSSLIVLFLICASLPWLAAWLVFLNPYTEHPSRAYIIAACGFGFGVISLLGILYIFAVMWPRD